MLVNFLLGSHLDTPYNNRASHTSSDQIIGLDTILCTPFSLSPQQSGPGPFTVEPRFVRVTPDVILRLLLLDLWKAIAFSGAATAAGVVAARCCCCCCGGAEVINSLFHN